MIHEHRHFTIHCSACFDSPRSYITNNPMGENREFPEFHQVTLWIQDNEWTIVGEEVYCKRCWKERGNKND